MTETTKGLTFARAVIARLEKIQDGMANGILPPVPDRCTPEQYAEFAELLRPMTILGKTVKVTITHDKG